MTSVVISDVIAVCKDVTEEMVAVDSHVATVTAKDQDCQRSPDSDDCRISYSIRGGDGLGSFYIDNGGNIKTAAVLVNIFVAVLVNTFVAVLVNTFVAVRVNIFLVIGFHFLLSVFHAQ